MSMMSISRAKAGNARLRDQRRKSARTQNAPGFRCQNGEFTFNPAMIKNAEYGRKVEALVRERQGVVEVGTDKLAASTGLACKFERDSRKVDANDPRRVETVQQPEILPGAAADIKVPCPRTTGAELLQEVEAEFSSIAAPPVRRLHRENLPIEFWLH